MRVPGCSQVGSCASGSSSCACGCSSGRSPSRGPDQAQGHESADSGSQSRVTSESYYPRFQLSGSRLRLVSCVMIPRMTSRFRRVPTVARLQAPRPAVVEDRSSSAHHHRRIWSTKTVSAFCIFHTRTRLDFSRRFCEIAVISLNFLIRIFSRRFCEIAVISHGDFMKSP